LGEAGRIALTHCEVHWYQRIVDFVPGGHTAGLAVTGQGLEMLAGLLRDVPPREYRSIVAAEPVRG
jgi:hypothetical protein